MSDTETALREIQKLRDTLSKHTKEDQAEIANLHDEIDKLQTTIRTQKAQIQDFIHHLRITPYDKTTTDIIKSKSLVQEIYETWEDAVRYKSLQEMSINGSSYILDNNRPREDRRSIQDKYIADIKRKHLQFFIKTIEYLPLEYQDKTILFYDTNEVTRKYNDYITKIEKEYNETRDPILKLQIIWTIRLLHRVYEYVTMEKQSYSPVMQSNPVTDLEFEKLHDPPFKNLLTSWENWCRDPVNTQEIQKISRTKPDRSDIPPDDTLMKIWKEYVPHYDNNRFKTFLLLIGCPYQAAQPRGIEQWEWEDIIVHWSKYLREHNMMTYKEKMRRGNTDKILFSIREVEDSVIEAYMYTVGGIFEKVNDRYLGEKAREAIRKATRLIDSTHNTKNAEKERTIKAFHAREKAFKEVREDEIKHKIEKHKNTQKPRYKHRMRKSKLEDIDETKAMEKRLAQLQAKLEAFKTSMEKARVT